eukprot:gene18582-21147_t
MSELYGDAFKDDKREERLYGDDITDEKATFVYDPSKELPASKSNNVSFMKVEDLPLECRNILAVSETHICYSVTQKKNLLRIIDTQVGEKVILRGHENAVLDLRFAIAESGLLCSVDNGEVSGKAHTIHIAVAVQRAQESASLSHIRMFKVTDGQGLQKVVASNPLAVFSCHNLLALQWTRNHIITASAEDTSASSESAVYQVTLWSTELEARDSGRTAPTPTAAQTVTVHLPRSAAGTASSGLLNARLECALSLEPRAERYLLLTSRRSNLVACLALNPAYAGVGQPLYHITCLNLRAPVISADVVTVLGQAHHSAEAGEHLEVSAYQEAASDAGQASIQQYHVLFAQLFSLSAYHGLPEVRAQQQGQEIGTSDVATAGMMIPLATLLEGSPTKQRIAENNNITAAMEASNTKGMTILNMLNNMQRSTSSGSLSNSSSSQAASAPVAPAVLPSPGIVRPQPVPQPSPSAAAATNKLLDLLSGGSSAKKSPVEVKETKISGSEGLPAFLLATQPAKNSSILDVLKPKAVTPAPTAPVVAPSTPSAVRPVTTATLTPTAAAAPAVPVTATAKLVVPTPTRPAAAAAAAAAAPASSAKPLPTSAVTTTSANGSASTSASAGDKQIEQLTAAMRDLQASVAALSSNQQLSQSQSQIMSEQQGQQSVKQLQQAVRDLQAGQNKQSEQLLAAVRKAMEGEAKRANDQNTASTGTMRNEVSEQILKELVPAIANKVRDSVRDTVRDSLRAQLPVAFRESFESGLLPAFEAGAQAMFQQLQGAFVHGMQGVMQEGLRVQSINAATTEQLEQEVRELRETVSRLEGSVLALSSTVQSLTESLVAGTLSQQQSQGQQNSQQDDVPPAQDAFTLLAEGRVSDAIVRVLEDKDITVTVRLLELLTPSQVAACCSHLEILCITQQLAADMSVNIPIEGIGKRVDWIKNLVLSLFSSKNSSIYEDPNYDTHFKTMITVVLESISAAKRLVFSAQYDTGEDDALSSLLVPQSVGTDLQLLEYVIQSKM